MAGSPEIHHTYSMTSAALTLMQVFFPVPFLRRDDATCHEIKESMLFWAFFVLIQRCIAEMEK
jgi:hypothetical protein